MNHVPAKRPPRLFDRVAAILEEARANVVRTVNTRMVVAYWLIGREIVQEEQGGKKRAGYGDALLEDLSRRLTERYGKGYSVSSLRDFRQFHQVYAGRLPEIFHAVRGEFPPPVDTTIRDDSPASLARGPIHHEPRGELDTAPVIRHEARGELPMPRDFSPDLSWTHYRLLMRVENLHARSFYEIEAIRGRWSTPDLERQIDSLLFERMLKSRNRKGVLALARKGSQPQKPVDLLKDPFVLEFLNLPEGHELVESRFEQALVDHMRQFLLELGCGFAFVARQQRLTLDGDHFYVDLVFYHTRLKCYVLIDLKVGKLTQQDLGQMQLYVNYYDREICAPDDHPTVGLILCTDRNEAMVRYTLPSNQKQIFAARYRTALPSEAELMKLLRRDWDMVVREQGVSYGS
jgi:predicted nuclease of restriction endonuclease-like (RecB) superfamily